MVSRLYQHTDLNSIYTINAAFRLNILGAFFFLRNAVLIALIFSSLASISQAPRTFHVNYTDTITPSESFEYSDSSVLIVLKTEVIQRWQSQGYLTAHYADSGLGEAKIDLGASFSWATLTIPEEFSRFSGKLENSPVEPRELVSIGNQCISWLENQGYPFAQIKFANPDVSNNQVNLDVLVERGPLIIYDSLIVKSDMNMSSNFFEVFLEMKKGNPYSEKRIAGIPDKLKSLPYLQISRAPETTFHQDGSSTYLYLESKSANRFTGIIGIQQNDENAKATIIGQVELSLINSLRKGESFSVDWQRFQTESQTLNVNFRYPFILKSQLGVSGGLDIIRQDSTYSSTRAKGGVMYQFSGLNHIGGFAEQFSTSKLNSNLDFGNSRTTFYGLELDYSRVDNRLNPRAGIELRTQIATGVRQARDTTDQQSSNTIWKSSVTIDSYIPLGNFFSVHLGGQGHSVSANNLFDNELERIGGFSTIRGFDEASIFTSNHLIGTAEIRFDFDDLSNVFLFADQAWYDKSNLATAVSDTPLGLGIGASLGTNAGVFQISYALGQQFDNPILIKNAKLHFGFVSVF